jgi:hypothetical protein
MKKFDHNGDGVISMEEFYETLQACMWIWGFKPCHLSDLQPAYWIVCSATLQILGGQLKERTLSRKRQNYEIARQCRSSAFTTP